MAAITNVVSNSAMFVTKQQANVSAQHFMRGRVGVGGQGGVICKLGL